MCSEPPGRFGLEECPNAWTLGRFGALTALEGFSHAVTTRRGPDVTAVRRDGRAAAEPLAEYLHLTDVAWPRQVHAADVLVPRRGGPAGEGDALITDRVGLGLMVQSADCPLILLADPKRRSVAAVHASWRSTVRRIAARTVGQLAEQFRADPADLLACICPSAGPCCYEVGDDVLRAAVAGLGDDAGRFFPQRGGRMVFDLWSANTDQLIGAGVPADNVHCAGVCTICRGDLYPSYRAEGPSAGRFVAVIGMV